MLNPNVIIPFDGANDEIPIGFVRDTRFDSKFLKGDYTNDGVSGGNATHSHTASHNHAISSHTHTLSTGNPVNGNTHGMGNSGGLANADHTHSGNSSASNAETCQDTSMSLDASANLPPYYDVIFIKSTTYNLIPTNGMVFVNGDREGMTYHTASQDKFLRGADEGEDAGGTGGNAAHTHSQSHTHTANQHSHNNTWLGGASDEGEGGSTEPKVNNGAHHHWVYLNNATQNMNTDTTASDSQALIPVNKTIKHYVATTSTLPLPGDIAIFIGDDIPIGWVLCDGENDTPDLDGFYIKNATSAGVESGSNTHSHTISHGHTGNGSHTHSANGQTGMSDDTQGRNGSGKNGRENHQHNVTGISSTTANYATRAAASTDVNNEPPYLGVKFIQFMFDIGGGALFAMA